MAADPGQHGAVFDVARDVDGLLARSAGVAILAIRRARAIAVGLRSRALFRWAGAPAAATPRPEAQRVQDQLTQRLGHRAAGRVLDDEPGEDVVEEPVVEPSLEAIPGYDEEARIQYTGGLSEDTGEESLAE